LASGNQRGNLPRAEQLGSDGTTRTDGIFVLIGWVDSRSVTAFNLDQGSFKRRISITFLRGPKVDGRDSFSTPPSFFGLPGGRVPSRIDRLSIAPLLAKLAPDRCSPAPYHAPQEEERKNHGSHKEQTERDIARNGEQL
jgi:hypothetical protein